MKSPIPFLDLAEKVGLSYPWAEVVLMDVIFIEILLGILALIGLYQRYVFVLISCLFVLFSFVLCVALVNHVEGSCGCFGNTFSSEINVISIVRNAFLSGISYYASIFLRPKSISSIDVTDSKLSDHPIR